MAELLALCGRANPKLSLGDAGPTKPAETPLDFRALPGVTRRPQDLENFPISADPFMN
jgi:hypothetical protein